MIIYLKNIPDNILKIIAAQKSWKNFFFEKVFFERLGAFSATDLDLIFCHKKLILYFFQVWLFSFSIILKTCFKNSFRETLKNWCFYSFKWATQTLQITLRTWQEQSKAETLEAIYFYWSQKISKRTWIYWKRHF